MQNSNNGKEMGTEAASQNRIYSNLENDQKKLINDIQYSVLNSAGRRLYTAKKRNENINPPSNIKVSNFSETNGEPHFQNNLAIL